MTVLDIDNAYFIDKLTEYIGQDVLLFGLDGMSYYGLLQEIDANNIATLLPASLSSTGLVEIQTPAEVAAVLNTVSIELCRVIAFGYDITANPFVIPNDEDEDVPPQESSAASEISSECCEPVCDTTTLIGKLIEAHQVVAVSTLGGFIFAGRIKMLRHKLLKLESEYVFAPGGDGSTLFSIGKTVINLDASTAVGS